MITPQSTVAAVQVHFMTLYGKHNLITDQSFPIRANHVMEKAGDLANAKRKEKDIDLHLAKMTDFFLNAVNYFNGYVDLQKGMMWKFPPYGCLYCEKMPCKCHHAQRNDPVEYRLYPEQYSWTLTDFQNHLFRVYGHNHKDYGKIYLRLASEFSEFSKIMSFGSSKSPNDQEEMYKELHLEGADFMSWLLTLSYFENYDLQQLLIKYYSVCPGCTLAECRCPPFFVSSDGRYISTTGMQRNMLD